jgi:hypothetical protein
MIHVKHLQFICLEESGVALLLDYLTQPRDFFSVTEVEDTSEFKFLGLFLFLHGHLF